ncbi:TetR/AcrR family transcriptional regulator [Nocardia sp. NPDC005978]|uniref:TetR/AcrR family transcriptional regulator n=1 Tax=Nocardia sp. NPDC005978 TaxID=3156725 RepID=UPI0033A6E95C
MPRANPIDKHDARRRALADSALRTLGELGYAKSSLREIANNSEFSHGVVHYYFSDKLQLIVFCVQQYKQTCVTRYDGVVADATTPAGLLAAFADKLCETIVEEAPMHRLWYDLRSQSMFEPDLREPVAQIDRTLEDMVWRVVARYAELCGAEPSIAPNAAYGLLDGLFQQALLGYLAGEQRSLATLSAQVHQLLPLLLDPARASAPHGA